MRKLACSVMAIVILFITGCTTVNEPRNVSVERSSVTTVNLPNCDIQYGADNNGNLVVCCTDRTESQVIPASVQEDSDAIVKFEPYNSYQKINASDDYCMVDKSRTDLYQDSNYDDNWAATLEVNDPLEFSCILGDIGTFQVQVTVSGQVTLGCAGAWSPITLSATVDDNDFLDLILGRGGDVITIYNTGSGVSINIDTGDGDDSIDINQATETTFDYIQCRLGEGDDVLVLNLSADALTGECEGYGNQGADTLLSYGVGCDWYGGIGGDFLVSPNGSCYGYLGTDSCSCFKEYSCEL